MFFRFKICLTSDKQLMKKRINQILAMKFSVDFENIWSSADSAAVRAAFSVFFQCVLELLVCSSSLSSESCRGSHSSKPQQQFLLLHISLLTTNQPRCFDYTQQQSTSNCFLIFNALEDFGKVTAISEIPTTCFQTQYTSLWVAKDKKEV